VGSIAVSGQTDRDMFISHWHSHIFQLLSSSWPQTSYHIPLCFHPISVRSSLVHQQWLSRSLLICFPRRSYKLRLPISCSCPHMTFQFNVCTCTLRLQCFFLLPFHKLSHMVQNPPLLSDCCGVRCAVIQSPLREPCQGVPILFIHPVTY
jgi:hypothetical protein